LNKLSLDYPSDKFELIAVSDCSTDKTDNIIKKYQNKKVAYLRNNPRQGKTAALNRAVKEARGEILVFADANSIYDPQALTYLMRNFADPEVGYVTGKMIYVNETGDMLGDGCTKYMKYENWLRELETNIGSIVGVDGGIDAVRKDLFVEMPADIQSDFYLPLSVIEKGYRVVFEDQAILKENTLNTTADEFRMRVRVILRALHVLWLKMNLLNPFKYGIFAFQMFFHKLLRYLAGFFQIAIFALNIYLLEIGLIYKVLLVGQIIIYAAGAMGFLLEKTNKSIFPVNYIYYINLLNFSGIVAFIQFLFGKKQVVWTPRKG
jgi:cellulose synthase/poly-beta-1,6-N-acetylglucosamine synthase-like glycosyltransferase